MNKSHNSRYCRYGKYFVFAVVFALVFMVSSAVLADVSAEESTTGQEHWSNVSKVVRELRSVAGQPDVENEVRQVAQDEEDSAKTVKDAMDKVSEVGKLRTLFFGTDYKNLGALRSELVKTQNSINRLTKAMQRATDVSVKADLQKQIDALKAIQAKAEAFIKDHESQFSFLGWFVRLFSK